MIKRLGASVHRALGVYRERRPRRPHRADRPQKRAREFVVDAARSGGAQNNELVLAEPLAGRASGLPRARVVERLGSMDAPQARSASSPFTPTAFRPNSPKRAIDEAERAQPRDCARAAPTCAHIPLVTIDPEDARDHDDAVWAGPDDDPANAAATS